MTRKSLIVAMAKNRVIGMDNKIPWHIPEDFAYFKKMTMGKPVIMGRKTFESIHSIRGTEPNSPALPKRQNIIITRQTDYTAQDCIICHSLAEAFEAAKKTEADEIMVIGGSMIYAEAMPYLDRMYITVIDDAPKGDAFFPKWDENAWGLTSDNPQTGYSFKVYDRQP